MDELLNVKKSWGTKTYFNKTKKRKETFMQKILYSIICGLVVSLLVLWPFYVFADINGKYDYQWDNQRYEAHQQIGKLEKNTWDFEQTYFIAHDRGATYKYNMGFISKQFQGNIKGMDWAVKGGPGVLSTTADDRDTIQATYRFNMWVKPNDKSNIEFNAERIPQMNANGQGDITFNTITNNIIDSYTLTRRLSGNS